MNIFVRNPIRRYVDGNHRQAAERYEKWLEVYVDALQKSFQERLPPTKIAAIDFYPGDVSASMDKAERELAGNAFAISGSYDVGGGASVPLPKGEWSVLQKSRSTAFGNSGEVVVLGNSDPAVSTKLLVIHHTIGAERWRSDARRCQALRTAIGLQQQVNHLIAYQVTPFEQDRLGAHGQQFFGGRGQSVSIHNVVTQQQSCFVQIRSDYRDARKQLADQHFDGVSSDQTVTAGCHHHGVKHHAGELIMVNSPSHDLDNLRCMQHPDLDGVNADVFNHRLDLRLQKLGRHSMDALDTQGVLRCQRSDRTHAVATQGGKCFQVGLNASPAPTVRAGDGEDTCVTERGVHKRNYPHTTKGTVQ